MGSVSSFKITEKVHICPLCKGLGFVFDPVLNYQPNEVVLLHSGAVLSELFTNADSPSDFELRVKSALTLILLKKDLWEEIRDRRTGVEMKDLTPESVTVAADFGARLYSKSQSVLKTIERGRMSARTGMSGTLPVHTIATPLNRALKVPDVSKTGSHTRLTIKYRSKESKKISAILGGTMGGGSARRSGEVGFREKDVGMAFTVSSAIAIPPPGTVKNPFAPPTAPPPLVVQKVLGSDLRSALIKTFLETGLLKDSALKVRRC